MVKSSHYHFLGCVTSIFPLFLQFSASIYWTIDEVLMLSFWIYFPKKMINFLALCLQGLRMIWTQKGYRDGEGYGGPIHIPSQLQDKVH